MCAQGPPVVGPRSVRAELPEQAAVDSLAPESMFDDLAKAISARKVESICTSYLALLRATGKIKAKERLAKVEAACGKDAVSTIIAAFSHRKCFMCDDGVASCPTCGGGGQVDRFPCPTCDGDGTESCTFCQGSGWWDRADVPVEFRTAVLRAQLAGVSKSLARLARLPDHSKLAQSQELPLEARREIIPWLVRLRARLDSLTSAGEGIGELAFKSPPLTKRIDDILEALRPKAARQGQASQASPSGSR